jgi:hypothetical protein
VKKKERPTKSAVRVGWMRWPMTGTPSVFKIRWLNLREIRRRVHKERERRGERGEWNR